MSQFTPRRRNSLRCPGHDYRGMAVYLVTLCVAGRLPVLGEVQGAAVRLSSLGQVVWCEWRMIAERFPSVRLDEMVIMPDHLHAIVGLPGPSENGRGDPSGRPSLGSVVGQFKSRVTKASVNGQLWSRGDRIWQRGYHDRILRSEEALVRARGYVRMNPIRWPSR